MLAELGATDISDDGHTVEVTVGDAGPAVLAAVRKLDGAGIEPLALSVREPSLDDVFLSLTGRPTETEEAD